MQVNDFKNALKTIDSLKGDDVGKAIETVREVNERVQNQYDVLLNKIDEQKNIPVKTVPPFTWYQDLHRIYIEVKHANRFDVAGCGRLFNET